jgi:Ca2+:H+ antiporter
VGGLTTRERIALGVIVVFTALAGVARYSDVNSLVAFGPAITGVLQSTLGNLPELFVVIFALRAGQTVVAQTSIIGSIFANALFVLGIVIVVGAWRSERNCMTFSARLPNDTATLLLLCNFIIVLIGLSLASNDPASHHVKGISTIGAVCLLAVYAAWLVRYLQSDRPASGEAAHAPRVPLRLSVILLAIAGVGSAFVSDWFIHALEPAIEQIGVSQAFAGLVIVAIAGNAVENATGVVLAAKGQSDLAISVVKNSVAQIAAFLYPVLVLISLGFSHTLTFALQPVYIGALALTAIMVWQVTGDGQATEFEGAALIATYIILAALTLYE